MKKLIILISFFPILFLLIILFSCDKENIDQEKYIYPLSLYSSRCEGHIVLGWYPPVIALRYSLNIGNPNAVFADRYELYVSESDTTNFQRLGEIQLDWEEFTYPENEFGKDYFFIVKCSAKGAYPSFSNIVWVKGGGNPETNTILNIPVDHTLSLVGISKDGNHLIYTRATEELCCNNIHAFTYDLATDIEKLSDYDFEMSSLSTDENELAFVSHFGVDTMPQPNNLGFINLQTDEISQLTGGYNNIQFPIWSEDDAYIYYLNTNEDFYHPWEIHQYSMTSNESIVLLGAEVIEIKRYPMSLSIKDKQLAFTGRDKSNSGSIYFYDFSSDDVIPLEQTEWNEYNPAFSFDGNYLAFISNRSGKEEIWVIDLQNSQDYQMTGEDKVYPQGKLLWAHDNSNILFKANGQQDDGVFSVEFKP